MNLVVRDIDARQSDLRRWAVELAPQPDLGLDEDVIEAVRATVVRLLDTVDPAESPLARSAQIVAAEQLAGAFRTLRAQRASSDRDVLILADAVAKDAYAFLVERAKRLNASADFRRWPAPLVALEPMGSPVTYVRGRSAQTAAFYRSALLPLPFPLVLIPTYSSESLHALTAMHHELGHNIDEDLSLTPSVEPVVDGALLAAGFSPAERERWTGWCRELIADTIGAFLAGSPLIKEMADWAPLLPGEGSTSHPPPSLRVRWIEQCLGDRGPKRSSTLPPVDPADARALPVAFESMLRTPLESLGGHAIADLAPDLLAQEETLAAARALSPAALERTPLRLFPSVARNAAMLGQAGAAATLRTVAASRPLVTSAALRFEMFRERVLKTITAPILNDERDGRKLPPLELMVRSDDVALCGATHERLIAMLEDFEQLRAPKKKSLEVFFLDDDTVRRTDFAERTPQQQSETRRAVLARLTPDLLNRIAERWRIAEHDEPFHFASHWNADRPGGRIHMSAHGWGNDVSRAPAFDFMWPAHDAAPTRTYRFYLEALEHLRRRAKTLSESTSLAKDTEVTK